MSMNVQVSAIGTVITPNGEKMQYIEEFPLTQTRTADTVKILESEDKYETYKSLYKDPGNKLKKWIVKQEKYGFAIDWCMT